MINPFKKISEEEKNILLKNLEGSFFHVKKNESLHSILRLNNAIGIVIEGLLHNIKTDYKGNQIIIEELPKDSLFGSSLSLNIEGETEIIAKKDSDIVILDYSTIINYQHTDDKVYNQFIINLLANITQLITLRNERIRLLTVKTTRDKLLEYFRILAKQQGVRNIHIPFTYTELADYLSVDRSAMMREIKNLKEEKIIEVKSKKITLLYR